MFYSFLKQLVKLTRPVECTIFYNIHTRCEALRYAASHGNPCQGMYCWVFNSPYSLSLSLCIYIYVCDVSLFTVRNFTELN